MVTTYVLSIYLHNNKEVAFYGATVVKLYKLYNIIGVHGVSD